MVKEGDASTIRFGHNLKFFELTHESTFDGCKINLNDYLIFTMNCNKVFSMLSIE